jgi:hypothetical protein
MLFKMDTIKNGQLTFMGAAKIAEERKMCDWAKKSSTPGMPGHGSTGALYIYTI